MSTHLSICHSLNIRVLSTLPLPGTILDTFVRQEVVRVIEAQKQGGAKWRAKARMLLYRLPEGVWKQGIPGMGIASIEALRFRDMPGISKDKRGMGLRQREQWEGQGQRRRESCCKVFGFYAESMGSNGLS